MLASVLPALPVSAQDLAIQNGAACAPVSTRRPSGAKRILGGMDPRARMMYGTGEQIVIDAGTSDGVQIGQRYFVRREIAFHQASNGEDTLGWVVIIATTNQSAIATVQFACDGIMADDHLEPFKEPILPEGIERTDATGTLDFRRTGRILYGERGRRLAGGRDFMIANMGQEDGAVPGARYAIYRRRADNDIPAVLFGEAIVVSASEDRSLIRVTTSRDAVETGDTLIKRVGGESDLAARGGIGAGGGAGGQQGIGGANGEGGLPGGGVPGSSSGSVSPAEALLFKSLNLDEIYFEFDRYTLRPEALALLDQAVKALSDNPAIKVQIEGHTCNIGTAEYNMALGERRANAVRDYLINRGVAASRFSTISYGEEKPKYDNAREETRRLNRRAALTVNLQR